MKNAGLIDSPEVDKLTPVRMCENCYQNKQILITIEWVKDQVWIQVLRQSALQSTANVCILICFARKGQ